jgi:hypothetical protein
LFAALMLILAAQMTGLTNSNRDPVVSSEGACSLASVVVSNRLGIARSRIAGCDVIPADQTPNEFYVLAVHSDRRCEDMCSTNLGWFAVHKESGRVFDWDVAEWKLGAPVIGAPT